MVMNVVRTVGMIALLALPSFGNGWAGPVDTEVIVIVADDLGVDVLDCYGEGNDRPSTPNICGLQADGVLFRNAWSNPTCSPTRATIQTGRYGFRNGVMSVGQTLPSAEITLPEVLSNPDNLSLGFESAAIGKWHLNGSGRQCGTTTGYPGDQGYDYAAGALANIVDYFDWTRAENAVCATSTTYATTTNVDDALAWIGTQGGPWLLWLAFNAPHAPFQAPPDDCPQGPCHHVSPLVPEGQICTGKNGGADEERQCYKAMVETLDTEIGRLLSSLPANPQRSVIFVGDNGSPKEVIVPPFDAQRAKFTVFEGGINVPLIVSGAGVVNGNRESSALVNTTDLFATVLELAGAVLPAGLVHDSVSLLPILADQSTGSRSYAYAERPSNLVSRCGRAVRNDRFKLILCPDESSGNEIQLYDLPQDPFEDDDLYVDGQPDLDPDEAANYEDLNEYLDFLDDRLSECAHDCLTATGGACMPSNSCIELDPESGACELDGELVQCPPGEEVRFEKCSCVPTSIGNLCDGVKNQSWSCVPAGG